MTIEEFQAKFDDEHQVFFYAASVLESEGEQQAQLLPEDQTWNEQRKILGFE